MYVLDTQSQLELAFNARERFAMCSTFKLLLAAAVLRRVDAGTLTLDHKLSLRPEDMVAHAPVTSLHLAEGSMSVRDLCSAIVTVSDNPAANVLLAATGGPSALTQFLRGIGDRMTRLDRTELELNTNLPGDPRDTTSPSAMLGLMQALLLGNVLRPDSRAKLTGWMEGATTGLKRLRAGLPPGWRAGDKTGNGANGAANDIAIAWPPDRAPILIASYVSGAEVDDAARHAAHATVGRVVAGVFG